MVVVSNYETSSGIGRRDSREVMQHPCAGPAVSKTPLGTDSQRSVMSRDDSMHKLKATLAIHFLFRRHSIYSVFVMKSKSADIALFGNNVTLNCNLTIPANVLQITWQKLQGSIPENIGTYSSQHGGKILPPYNERIHCSSTELTSSSMTIYNVTLKDAACYKCLFNVFPNGIYGGKMCFSVQKVSELRSELHPHPTIEGILIVICSATGKPAPHITFSHERLLMGLPKEHIDQNPDGITNVTKWYNISKEAVRSLKIQNASCVMDHPLRKKKELVYFSQEPECK
ncbi:OX-2 membrane glycoprotein-like [Sarcophilus harrisii]|uniref:OX-2 membrane glycoprotein-like n=1 Tax=Sarcophilus harrisii TaxID=9305 RepID=UPI001301E116|nr:OX-2 membrane glycoprotein-like [Sarcophilus harrisii]